VNGFCRFPEMCLYVCNKKLAQPILLLKQNGLDVARTLQISPAAAERLVKCKVGDRLAAGAEVAKGKSLLARTVRVPREGTVVAVGGGQVLLEVGESKVELRAGIPGTVVEVMPGRGVVIQTAGSLIQGIWGNGKVDTGV
jgi:hypothetical protein